MFCSRCWLRCCPQYNLSLESNQNVEPKRKSEKSRPKWEKEESSFWHTYSFTIRPKYGILLMLLCKNISLSPKCRQLLPETSSQTPYRGFVLGTHWSTSVPHTSLLQSPRKSLNYTRSMFLSQNFFLISVLTFCRNVQITVWLLSTSVYFATCHYDFKLSSQTNVLITLSTRSFFIQF